MLKSIILIPIATVVGATLVAAHFNQTRSRDQERKTSDMTASAHGADRLQVTIPIGQATIIADGSRDLTVHVVRSARKPMDRVALQWMNDSFVSAEDVAGVLVVRDHPFGKDKGDRVDTDNGDGNWSRDLKVELTIHAPSDLAAKLTVSYGTARLSGRYREIEARVGAGTLTAESIRSTGPERLNVGAGELTANLASDSSGDSSLHVGAGKVDVGLPADADADVTASVGIGSITGLPERERHRNEIYLGDERRGRFGNGAHKVQVNVGTGKIRVRSASVDLVPGEI
jgi:hypothetical protein